MEMAFKVIVIQDAERQFLHPELAVRLYTLFWYIAAMRSSSHDSGWAPRPTPAHFLTACFQGRGIEVEKESVSLEQLWMGYSTPFFNNQSIFQASGSKHRSGYRWSNRYAGRLYGRKPKLISGQTGLMRLMIRVLFIPAERRCITVVDAVQLVSWCLDKWYSHWAPPYKINVRFLPFVGDCYMVSPTRTSRISENGKAVISL